MLRVSAGKRKLVFILLSESNFAVSWLQRYKKKLNNNHKKTHPWAC